MAEDQPPLPPDPAPPSADSLDGALGTAGASAGPVDPAAGPAADPAADNASVFDQASVDELLRQSGFGAPADPAQPGTPTGDASAAGAGDFADLAGLGAGGADPFSEQASIEELLRQASFDDPAALAAGVRAAPEASEYKLPNFQQVMQDAQASSIDLLRDVDLNVKIELGRARMLVEDVLKLSEGSVVELDKLAGDPVDVFVNDRLVARGEVLVLNDNFCVRVNEIVAGVKDEGA